MPATMRPVGSPKVHRLENASTTGWVSAGNAAYTQLTMSGDKLNNCSFGTEKWNLSTNKIRLVLDETFLVRYSLEVRPAVGLLTNLVSVLPLNVSVGWQTTATDGTKGWAIPPDDLLFQPSTTTVTRTLNPVQLFNPQDASLVAGGLALMVKPAVTADIRLSIVVITQIG